MKTLRIVFFCCIAVIVIRCAPQAPAVDLEAEEAAVMNADADWAAAAKTVEGHLAAFADDAVVHAPNEAEISGKAAISEMLKNFHDTPGFSVHWQANSAVVSSSGDLAYTLGRYRFTAQDTAGNPIADQGKYVTVWKKQNGEWKVAVDAFNSDLPAH